MRAYNKNLVNFIAIVLCILMTLFIVVKFEGHDNREIQEFITEYFKDSQSFELALCTKSNIEGQYKKNLVMKWWYNDKDDTYYLFIPGNVAKQKLIWAFNGVKTININDREISPGQTYDETEGKYLVSLETPDGIQEYQLEILYTSAISSMFIETDSGSMAYIHESKENKEGGSFVLLDSNGDIYENGRIESMNCRGNSSWEETDKKAYKLKLCEKTDFFNMGKSKKWLLIANAFDDTLLRNVVAFDIAQSMEMAYTPEVEFVDVYANGEFIGNYLLSEKIEIGKNRVNITNLEEEMENINECNLAEYEFFMEPQGRLFSTKGYRIENNPEDISGGYLLELETSDRYGLEASGFLTSRMQPVVFVSPEYASYEQVSYIAERYQDFEDAIFSDDGYSPYSGKYYMDYIDMDSFARKYLLEELTKNLDASFTSQYLYKPVDSVSEKFFAGPAWDYDKSIAASGVTEDGIDLHEPSGLYAAVQEKDSDIWYALYKHEDFRKYVADMLHYEMDSEIKNIAQNNIPAYADKIRESSYANMVRWDTFSELNTKEEKMERYDEKVSELSDFLEKRLDFLENEWSELIR